MLTFTYVLTDCFFGHELQPPFGVATLIEPRILYAYSAATIIAIKITYHILYCT